MKSRVIVFAVLCTASVGAQAQLYRWDNGVSNDSIGTGGVADIAWLEQFKVVNGFSHITSVQTTFGSSGIPNESGVTVGQSFRVFVWKGTPTGTGVDAPTLLASTTATVAPNIIDTNNLQTVNVSADITGTTNFFIGADINATSGYPAPIQDNSDPTYPILDNSWLAGSLTSGGFDPNDLGGGDFAVDKNSNYGLAGNWILRATATQAVPEPTTMAALGLGALGLIRRRRAKRA